jgi:hypothetical protein
LLQHGYNFQENMAAILEFPITEDPCESNIVVEEPPAQFGSKAHVAS